MLSKFLAERYPGNFSVSCEVEMICQRFIGLKLADTNFATDLCTGDENKFWQRFSEALLAHELLEAGLTLLPKQDGPDLLIQHKGRNIWVEVMCPESRDLPDNFAEISEHRISEPHKERLLRWTAAIKEKSEKLLGNPDKKIKGYIAKGIVGPDDAYVIAINGRLLRGTFFASIDGISTYPYAVEAVFNFGPKVLSINVDTRDVVGEGHQYRPLISKSRGEPVPADTFLNPAFSRVSAIWATDVDERSIYGDAKQMAVIHNPNAVAKHLVPAGILPALYEYFIVKQGDEDFLERRPGRMHPEA